jgi:tetratricopeptide (TPR) repeat protein
LTAGNYGRALDIAEEARAQLDRVDDPHAQAVFLCGIATFEAMAGRFEQARADAERGLELAHRARNILVIAEAHHGLAWALQRDDPAAALAAAERYIELNREFDIGQGAVSTVMALAGGLRARLGDDSGALELLNDAVQLARDLGARPQVAATLDWALAPLVKTGHPEVTATLLGALAEGPLAEVANFPGVAAARSRSRERVQGLLGETETDELAARGAAMEYDEVVEFAIANLDPNMRNEPPTQ